MLEFIKITNLKHYEFLYGIAKKQEEIKTIRNLILKHNNYV